MMNKFNCENLTKLIDNLAGIKSELDLALDNFNLSESFEIKLSAMKIFESFDASGIIRSLGYENYKILLERVGSEGELESRISTLQIGGKSFEELSAKLKSANVSVDYVGNVFTSEYFKTLPKQTEIKIIKLSLADLGLVREPQLFQDWRAAKNLGLETLPPEAVIYQRLADKAQPANDHYDIFVGNTETSPDRAVFFNLFKSGEKPMIFYQNHAMSYQPTWKTDSNHLFLLPDRRRKAGSE